MNLWPRIVGQTSVKLTSAELTGALQAINMAGISIDSLIWTDELSCSFRIHRKDFPVLEKICRGRGEKILAEHQTGICVLCHRAKDRKLLLVTLGILLLLILLLPTRVLIVRVEGNEMIPDKQILAAAEDWGIHFGAARRDVRSEKVKNALLSAVPELKWAGVDTRGCVAVISVREREEPETQLAEHKVSSILAARDGYILSGTVTRGNGLFRIGQTVHKGDLLISGYTDCGRSIQATRAEGEIYAQTNHRFEAVKLKKRQTRTVLKRTKQKFSIQLGKKRINLWKGSGISDASCGRMYKEYYITLPGGYLLPAALCIEEYQYWEVTDTDVPREAAFQVLSCFAEESLAGQMTAGRILFKEENLVPEQDLYRFRGSYICTEMIGREQLEQIGDTNGKSN